MKQIENLKCTIRNIIIQNPNFSFDKIPKEKEF